MQAESNAVMIESSYLSGSLWSPELNETLDFDTVPYESPFDFEEPTFDCNDIESANLDLSSINTCSDDLDCWPIDLNSDFQLSAIVNEVICEDGDFSMTSLEFSADDKDELKAENNVLIPDSSAVCESDNRFKDAKECLMDKKFWSKKSSYEQTLTLNAISFLFTHHLSIKNQMEVIIILNPQIHFRPDDKEFSIRASDMNDLKLWKIREFMKKNVPKFKDLGSHAPRKSVASSRESSKKSNSKLTKRKSNLNYSRTKRKPRAKKAELNNFLKTVTQTEKELKSGFFVYEKKLKLCTSSTEEDEDINVLE